MIAAAYGLDATPGLRLRLADLYAAYDTALDEAELERWPDFFTEQCLYQVLPRENYDAGLFAALIYAESRAMLTDRVVALKETMFFAPRIIRRLTGNICLRAIEPDGMRLTASFALFQTMVNEPSELLLCGGYYDRVVDCGGVLRFAERICVTDATSIPTSLIYPI
jgi:3-phenylpropionate/cinnamic acid dioxygenase small subunit